MCVTFSWHATLLDFSFVLYDYSATPLCHAAKNGHLEVVRLLLASTAQADVNEWYINYSGCYFLSMIQ